MMVLKLWGSLRFCATDRQTNRWTNRQGKNYMPHFPTPIFNSVGIENKQNMFHLISRLIICFPNVYIYFHITNWLDLTWSWFYFSSAAVVPVAGVGSRRLINSNTWFPGGSVLWIDATKAASIHVSLTTIWPCLSWSPSLSWTWNLHIGDRIDTGWRSNKVSIQSKTLSA